MKHQGKHRFMCLVLGLGLLFASQALATEEQPAAAAPAPAPARPAPAAPGRGLTPRGGLTPGPRRGRDVRALTPPRVETAGARW